LPTIVPVHKNIVLGLGSNLGDREKNLLLAIKKINEQAGTVSTVSSLYETEPWGKNDQPEFLNQVIVLESLLYPLPLLQKLQLIELDLGRKKTTEWGARTLDIDILFYGNEIIADKHITVPHPSIADRKFVLEPLCEILPAFIHPLLQKSSLQLLKECKDELQVRLYYPDKSF
jgi:2-amino-4-hydroxy-6-hydroxymethyldihydropteridine diphosphokinase